MRSTRRRGDGFTLIEVLIAITITGLICSVFFLLIFSATRLWYLCSAHAQSYPDAALIVQRVTQDLKCAANNSIVLSDAYPPSTHSRTSYTDANGDTLYDTVTFQIPLQTTDVLNSNPSHYHQLLNVNEFPVSGNTLLPGQQITYYPVLLPTSFANSVSSYAIYRQVTNLTTGQQLTQEIANNALLPTFCAYGQTTGRVYAVYASVITLVGSQGATSYTSSYSTTIDIRNSLIPLSTQ